MALVLLALLASPVAGAEDPYATWRQGRPQEAWPGLLRSAAAGDDWRDWFDAGLAAHDAGRDGIAVACLARSFVRDPTRTEPRIAIAEITGRSPDSWTARCGPFAGIARGWTGAIWILLTGLGLGYGLRGRRWRGAALAGGGVLLALFLPVRLAVERDLRLPLLVAVEDCALADTTGRWQADIAAGTLLHHDRSTAWGDRHHVRLPDGSTGFVPRRQTVPIDDPVALAALVRNGAP
jgi:hypothetical protein